MDAKPGRNTEVREILYFKKPTDRANTGKMLEFVTGKIEGLNLRHVLIACSNSDILLKFLKASRNLEVKLDITTVTNPKAETTEDVKISIDDKTREKLEEKGVKVCYLNDDMKLGEPMAPTPHQSLMREMSLPWLPAHIDLVDFDARWDTSMLLVISQGLRVAIGCLSLAAQHGIIPRGERVLCVAGSATACVAIANPSPRHCYVEEILCYERNSDWALFNLEKPEKAVAVTE